MISLVNVLVFQFKVHLDLWFWLDDILQKHAYWNHLLICCGKNTKQKYWAVSVFLCLRRSSRADWSAAWWHAAAGPRNQSAGHDALWRLEPDKGSTWRTHRDGHQEESGGCWMMRLLWKWKGDGERQCMAFWKLMHKHPACQGVFFCLFFRFHRRNFLRYQFLFPIWQLI